jgi:serine/threonine protein kinase
VPVAPPKVAFRKVGQYALFVGEIASGGMATLHIGRRLGEAGFVRTVAIKRLRGNFASDPRFVAMFIDEARIAARIRHPNVTATVDVFRHEDELCLVLEYVHGESLKALLRAEIERGGRVAPRIAASVLCGALYGLHSAHEAKSEQGTPLGIVHRDISPQNILVGADGIARVVDFGIAKAAGRMETTEAGQIKGKFAYMAPEQLDGDMPVDRRTDVFSAGIVLWEALTGRRLFYGPTDRGIIENVKAKRVPALRGIARDVSPELEQVVLRGLLRDPEKRFQTAREFALAIEESVEGGPATAPIVGEWVEQLAKDRLDMLDGYLSAIEGAVPSDEDDARASVRRVLADEAEKTLDDGRSTLPPAMPRPPVSAPRISSIPTHVDGMPPTAAGGDALSPLFFESDTAVDSMTAKLRPFKDTGSRTHSSSNTLTAPKGIPAESATPEQVIASVLARPMANPHAERAPSLAIPADPPWTGALFEGESSVVMTQQMEPRSEATEPGSSPGSPIDTGPTDQRPKPRTARLPMMIGLGVLLVFVLVLWFVLFLADTTPEPRGGADVAPATTSTAAASLTL